MLREFVAPTTAARAMPALRQRISGLVRGASIETTTRPPALREACAAQLQPGTEIYITWLPGDRPAERIAAARALRGAGFAPVPHLAARYLASAAELHDLLARMNGEAAVEQILLIGGDTDRAPGPYHSSLAVLEDEAIASLGIRRLGLAAYPEGHPRIPAAVLDQALDAKLERARALGIRPYVVTQFCFEARPIIAWLARFRARWSDVPVHIGLAGPAKLSTLLTFAATCGIGASLRALKRPAGMTRLLAQSGPEPILHELALDPGCTDVAPLHIFTFGGIARTATWLGSIAAGAFNFSGDGFGFSV